MTMHVWVIAATLWVSLGVPAQAQPRVEYLTEDPPQGSCRIGKWFTWTIAAVPRAR